jgi:hypothetical protein
VSWFADLSSVHNRVNDSVGGHSDAEDAQRIRLVCDFYHERWTSNRSITAVDWSSKASLTSVAQKDAGLIQPSHAVSRAERSGL